MFDANHGTYRFILYVGDLFSKAMLLYFRLRSVAHGDFTVHDVSQFCIIRQYTCTISCPW